MNFPRNSIQNEGNIDRSSYPFQNELPAQSRAETLLLRLQQEQQQNSTSMQGNGGQFSSTGASNNSYLANESLSGTGNIDAAGGQGGFEPSSAVATQRQHILACQQALDAGVTPEMLEQHQRRMFNSGLSTEMSEHAQGQSSSASSNFSGGRGNVGYGSNFPTFTGCSMSGSGSSRPFSSSSGPTTNPGSGFEGFGGGDFGAASSTAEYASINARGGTSALRGSGLERYNTGVSGSSSNFAQEAANVKQEIQKLQFRQAQLDRTVAALGLSPSFMGSGGAGMTYESGFAVNGASTSGIEMRRQTGLGMVGEDLYDNRELGGDMSSPRYTGLQISKNGPSFGVEQAFSRQRAKKFPEKLMDAMLENPDEDAVAWLPDGKSFVIVDSNAFVERVLSPHFKESKYPSFVRKLHRWGFVRLTSGTGTDCFHHPLFRKDRRDLVSVMKAKPRHDSSSSSTTGTSGSKERRPLDIGLNSPSDEYNNRVATNIIEDGAPSLAGVEKFISSAYKKKLDGGKGDTTKAAIIPKDDDEAGESGEEDNVEN